MVKFAEDVSTDDGTKRNLDGQSKLPFSLKRKKPSRDKWTLIITIAALLATILFLLVAFLVVVRGAQSKHSKTGGHVQVCYDHCSLKIAETIPDGLVYPDGSPSYGSIVSFWHALLDKATTSLDIASSYWALRDQDVPGGPYTKYSVVGEEIFKKISEAADKKEIKVRIVQQVASPSFPQKDTEELGKLKNIEVRTLDFGQLKNGSTGIIHTKMWIVDGKHVYVGSANMDWRSVTQVKELGIFSFNCSCVGSDLSKIFEAYWVLAQKGSKIPQPWPSQFNTNYNKDNPLQFMDSSGRVAKAFMGSSPPMICPKNRTQDLDAILHVIKQAKRFIYISVMDYIPIVLYGFPKRYWGIIDDALKSAAYDRGIDVRLLASKWEHTKIEQTIFLKSLKDVQAAAVLRNGTILVKNFIVPPGTMKIPFTRVSHDKYMVTDNLAYIGTSNWVGDYFIDTAGVSYVINQTPATSSKKTSDESYDIRDALQKLFERDWNSKYTHDLG